MNILSLHSQVVAGHVGNAAAVLPLQLLGFEVWAVPTVLYSNHPGHGTFTGRVTPAGEIETLIDGLDQRGLLNCCTGVLVGYLGDAAQAEVAADTIARVRAQNPKARILCDPILGDRNTGLYVAKDIPKQVMSELIPRADMVTPNQFELETLTGTRIGSLDDAITAAGKLRAVGPDTVICTSLQHDGGPADQMETLLARPDGAWIVRNDPVAEAPHGAGDMLAALFLGHTILGASPGEALRLSVSTVWSVIAASTAFPANELALVAARANIEMPELSARIERVG